MKKIRDELKKNLVAYLDEWLCEGEYDRAPTEDIVEDIFNMTGFLDMYEALEGWEELWNIRPLDSGCDIDEILHRCWAKTLTTLLKVEGK